MGEPAAITGAGCVCALGWSRAEVWPSLRSGRVGIGPFGGVFAHERHRTHVAAAARERARGQEPPLSPRYSRVDAFALQASAEAVAESGVAALLQSDRAGVFFGTSTAGMLETERWYRGLRGGRSRDRALGAQQSNAPGDAVARHFRVRGPVCSVSTACVSGAQAIALALDALRSGEVDVAIAGGADGLCELTYAGFNALRAVDAEPCRPFRADRQGLSLGEGAGVLVLERAAHAAARGAFVLGTLAGAASTCDAHHMSAPEPSGAGASRAIQQALADAGVGPDAIDFVDVHGTGTPLNDAAEAAALHAVFGARTRSLPVTSTKSLVGHLLGAAGAFEAVATLQCLAAGEVHPTAGGSAPDAALSVDLVVGGPRRLARSETALSTNLAFGGANTALVLRCVRR